MMLVQEMNKAHIKAIQSPSDADLLIATTAIRASRIKPTVVIGKDTDLLILILDNIDNQCHDVFFMSEPKMSTTLKEETFAGRNFRGFAVFSQIRESLFPRNFSKDIIRESFFPRNFLKKSSSANILEKNTLL